MSVFFSSAMISYNITIGDTLTKVFQRIPGGVLHITYSASHKSQTTPKLKYIQVQCFDNISVQVMYMLLCIVFAVGPDHILAERHFVILLSTLTLTLPLSLYRNIEKLGKVRLIIIKLSALCSAFKAVCKTSVCVTRCLSCQWC